MILGAWRRDESFTAILGSECRGIVVATQRILHSGTMSEQRRRGVCVPSNCPWPWSRAAASCPVHFAKEGCALRLRTAISTPSLSFVLLAYSPSLSLSLSFSLFFSLLFCSFSPSLTRLFQYSIFIIRFQRHVSFIVWHQHSLDRHSDRRTILFPVLSSLRRRIFCLECSVIFGGILVSKRSRALCADP